MLDATADSDEAWIDHPSGFIALSPRNTFFRLPGRKGFIAYRDWGRHSIAFGGVHAPAGDRDGLLDGFLAQTERQGRIALFIQVREDAVPLFLARGMNVNQCGVSVSLRLERFNLAGPAMTNPRRMLKRARRAGVCVEELGAGLPRSPSAFARLEAITKAWLVAKKKPELDFMIGELGTADDRDRRIFVAARSGQMVGFLTCVPAWGRLPGYLLDLGRAIPDAPEGTMDALVAEALETLQREGIEFAHLGFVPFVFEGDEYPTAHRGVAWLARGLRRFGKNVYPADSQLKFKLKWAPDIVEREFLVGRPLSLRGVYDLLRLTRAL